MVVVIVMVVAGSGDGGGGGVSSVVLICLRTVLGPEEEASSGAGRHAQFPTPRPSPLACPSRCSACLPACLPTTAVSSPSVRRWDMGCFEGEGSAEEVPIQFWICCSYPGTLERRRNGYW
ncbi:hypothetical protein E2C01_011362 [Portunus trituberculatus]|uniref:Uncharacterized protein n=1 Tax=Portunus trituberculatus TaxID=210409 RepID=A0A5B7DBH9_PORTR|nr:hypothetical protein [Portunus trituberculatus]